MKWTWARRVQFDYDPANPFAKFNHATIATMEAEIQEHGLPFRGQYQGVYERTGLSKNTVGDYIRAYVKSIMK